MSPTERSAAGAGRRTGAAAHRVTRRLRGIGRLRAGVAGRLRIAARLRSVGRLRIAVPLLSLVLVGACAAGPEGDPGEDPPSPFADCAALGAPPGRPSGAIAAAGSPGPRTAAADQSGVRPLPDVQLPCFTGGATVALAALRGPAVVNIWASWCRPCRRELPAFQRLADSADGRVHVVGVDARDRREGARSLAVDLGLTFPNLVDREDLLRAGLGRMAFPITLFVDGQGRIRHLDESGALDDAALAALVERHLGVATGR